MDPNETLRRLLALAEGALDEDVMFGKGMETALDELQEMGELVQALDGWLKSGGFLPRRWAIGR